MTITELQPHIDARNGTAVTIYKTPTCRTCPGVIRMITARGYNPEVVDITEDPAADNYVRNVLHAQEVPVVVVSNRDFEDHWTGNRPDKVIEYLPKVDAA